MRMAQSLSRAFAVCMLVHVLNATEFDGYLHLDGQQLPYFLPSGPAPAPTDNAYATVTDWDGNPLPLPVQPLQALCDSDPKCISFGDKYNQFYQLGPNSTIDTYISTSSCGSSHKGDMQKVGGYCNNPATQYFVCQGTEFETDMLNQWDNIPAAVCEQLCASDAQCTVFVTTKDGNHCETYKWHDDGTYPDNTGYLKVSGMTPDHSTVVTPASHQNVSEPLLSMVSDFPGYAHMDGATFWTDCYCANDDDCPSHCDYANLGPGGGCIGFQGDAAVYMPSCDFDQNCGGFNADGELYHKPMANANVDTYFSTKTCGKDLGAPTLTPGSCNQTDIQYMSCPVWSMMQIVALNHFDLPPAVCASTCDQDDRCTVFVMTKDQQHCSTYSWFGNGTGNMMYLKVPAA